MEVSEIIDALKKHLNAETDSQLARKLGVDKATVAAWRRRNSVPPRYADMANGFTITKEAMALAPLMWNEHEKAAFRVALLRVASALKPLLGRLDGRTSQKLSRIISEQFFTVMDQAKSDIISIMHDDRVELASAETLVIFADVSNPSEGLKRDQALLEISHLLQTIVSAEVSPV